ncbi:hypothetical protein D3C80_575320 [compost metagenome]
MHPHLLQSGAHAWPCFTPGQQLTVRWHQRLQPNTLEKPLNACMRLEGAQGLAKAHRRRAILHENAAQQVCIDTCHPHYLLGLMRVDRGKLWP